MGQPASGTFERVKSEPVEIKGRADIRGGFDTFEQNYALIVTALKKSAALVLLGLLTLSVALLLAAAIIAAAVSNG